MSDSDGALVAPELAIFSVLAAATLVGRLGSCGGNEESLNQASFPITMVGSDTSLEKNTMEVNWHQKVDVEEVQVFSSFGPDLVDCWEACLGY